LAARNRTLLLDFQWPSLPRRGNNLKDISARSSSCPRGML
jgi:hypothetical protein